MKPSLISRTGRVQSWLDDPEGRLPVSCTVINVSDSMNEGRDSIEASWKFASHALRYGAGVAVHLTQLRSKGTENGKGLTSSGPLSFAKIYSALNETIRRGGKYKNGAVCLHYDLDAPDILDFITTPRDELPWCKRSVDITRTMWQQSNPGTRAALLHGIRGGDIWLNKVKFGADGERLYGNVCQEVYLKSRGTCLLQHVNLGACELEDIHKAFIEGMSQLCVLHGQTGVGKYGEYLEPKFDRQVGLGMLGLANLLKRYCVSYEDFGTALEQINDDRVVNSPAFIIAEQLQSGIRAAANIAKANNMERAFAIAPTASCSYRSKDLQGHACTPEIAPPVARSVDRDSGTFGVQTYEYGDVEIASEVGWDNYKKVADGIMTMLSRTGLLHGYSFNSWQDLVTYDEQFIEEWLDSPQTSLYYSLQVMGDVQDKTDAYAALDEADVNDYLSDLLNNEVKCDCAE